MIVAFISQKGGVGKTTTCVAVAAALHQRKLRVLVGDADKQGSAMTWAATGTEPKPTVIGLHGEFHRPGQLPSGFDHTFLDTPAQLALSSKAALVVADLAVVPVTPSGLDTWALARTLEVVQEARVYRPGLRLLVVPNRFDRRTNMGRSVLAMLRDANLPVAETTLGNRVAYTDAITAGMGITSYAPGSDAAREVEALTDELLALHSMQTLEVAS